MIGRRVAGGGGIEGFLRGSRLHQWQCWPQSALRAWVLELARPSLGSVRSRGAVLRCRRATGLAGARAVGDVWNFGGGGRSGRRVKRNLRLQRASYLTLYDIYCLMLLAPDAGLVGQLLFSGNGSPFYHSAAIAHPRRLNCGTNQHRCHREP